MVGRILDSGCRLKTVVGFEFYLPGCTSYRCLQQVIRLFFSKLSVYILRREDRDNVSHHDAPQSSQQKRKGAKRTRAQTKRQRVATPPPPPVSPIPVESSPSSPEVQMQQVSSPPPLQEAPQVEEPQLEEPQPEVPQPEDISADVSEQTTDAAGSIIASVVSSIQTSTTPPQGNISTKSLSIIPLFCYHNSFCQFSADIVPSATLADQPVIPSASSSQRREIALKQVSHPISISIICRCLTME